MERRNSWLCQTSKIFFSERFTQRRKNAMIYLINVFDSLKYWNFLMTKLNRKILTITMNFKIDLSDYMQKRSQQGQTDGKN